MAGDLVLELVAAWADLQLDSVHNQLADIRLVSVELAPAWAAMELD
jgi:hypothetical protein